MSRSFDPSSPSPSDLDDAVPSKLMDGLAELFPVPHVPASVDSAVLNAARAHIAGEVRRRRHARHSRLLRWAGVGAAAVAAAAAVLFVVLRPHTPPAVPRAAIAGDINGDGRVDILDAYLVARALSDKTRTAPLPVAWDVNHDGVVDQKDVDWIANAAVRVDSGPVAASVSKHGGSADVFELAEKLKSLDVGHGFSKVALLDKSKEAFETANSQNAHGACTVGPAPQAASISKTHGASTVGVRNSSQTMDISDLDDAKGATQ